MDHNGKIDFNEFVNIIMEYLLKTFKLYDKNGDGVITKSELKEAITKLKGKVSESELDEMIKEMDENGDGKIDYEGSKLGYNFGF